MGFKSIFADADEIKKMYVGQDLVWERAEEDGPYWEPDFNSPSGQGGNGALNTETREALRSFTLYVQRTSGNIAIYIRKSAEGTYTHVTNTTTEITEEDQLTFRFSDPGTDGGDADYNLRVGSVSGDIIQELSVTYSEGCYLTTTMVNYYGYEDDGPELTAMRKLREEKGSEYQDMLANYFQESPIIIEGINNSEDPEYYYNLIRTEVLATQQAVNQEDFDSAAQIYINLYLQLKSTFINEV